MLERVWFSRQEQSPTPWLASFLISAKVTTECLEGKSNDHVSACDFSVSKSHETRTELYQDQWWGLCGPGIPWTSLEVGRDIAVRPWARLQLEIWVWALQMVLFLQTLDLFVVPGDGQSPRAVCITEEYIEKNNHFIKVFEVYGVLKIIILDYLRINIVIRA